jgi:hypothetical protein
MEPPLWTGKWFMGTDRTFRANIKKRRKTAVGGDGLEPPTLSV